MPRQDERLLRKSVNSPDYTYLLKVGTIFSHSLLRLEKFSCEKMETNPYSSLF